MKNVLNDILWTLEFGSYQKLKKLCENLSMSKAEVRKEENFNTSQQVSVFPNEQLLVHRSFSFFPRPPAVRVGKRTGKGTVVEGSEERLFVHCFVRSDESVRLGFPMIGLVKKLVGAALVL